ncbi:MAG: hypothetical protein MUF16_17860 [Burkholderiaceae bacterium]|jgi:hypothetical protein|nr:hypothetical protein [Burkholderiaceae bacterium]
MAHHQTAGDGPTPDPFEPGLPGEEPTQAQQLAPEYWRAFSITTFTMNRFIVDQVIRAARFFDNDTEAMILYATVAHLNAAHLLTPGSSPSKALRADGRVPDAQAQLRPVRIRDLAQITGRPRETIRRKMERLEAQGRLLKLPEGYVLDVRSVDGQLHTLSVDSVRRFMQTARVIEAALHDAEQALAREAGGAAP